MKSIFLYNLFIYIFIYYFHISVKNCFLQIFVYMFYDKQNLMHVEIKLGVNYEMDTANNHSNS